jgi:hypothetical protein
VINADDTFFSEEMLGTPNLMIRPATDPLLWRMFYNYLLKAVFTRIARPVCAGLPFICAQKLQTLWRKRETGEWLWQDTFEQRDKAIPIDPARRPPSPDEAAMRGFEKAASVLIGTLRLSRDCIILTAIPNSVSTSEPIAERIGKGFQLPVVVPHVDNLATIDDSHLNGPSAERWSGAFLREAAPALDRCLAAGANRSKSGT